MMKKQMTKTGCSLLMAGVLLGTLQGIDANAKEKADGISYQKLSSAADDSDDDWETEWDKNPDNDQEDEEDEDEDTDVCSFADCDFEIQDTRFAYTGQKLEPKVTVSGVRKNAVTGEDEKVTLTEGTDYTVSYENNKNYGVGRVILQGIGNYTGYHIEKFGIMPETVTGVKVSSPFYLENTVTWNKAKGADGYYIYRKASGKVTKTITKNRFLSYTGDAIADYMIYLTNQKIIKGNMSDDRRVKAIYDWMVKNCTFTKDVKEPALLKKMKQYYKYDSAAFQKKAAEYEKKLQKQIYQGKVLCTGTNFYNFDRGFVALSYHQGSCSFLTPMFNMLCRASGVETHGIDGYYVNKDKTKDYHNWSFARIGKTYYWYDVAVAAKNKSAKAVWYKKGTAFWKTCHAWNKNATKGWNTAGFAK